MDNVMLDLETYGNTPGCMVLSIGACAFDWKTGEIDKGFYTTVYKGGEPEGLHRDESTVLWWRGQTPAAKQVLRDCKNPVVSADLTSALDMLDAYVNKFGGFNCSVWGNGSDFDNAIIRAAYRVVNVDREPAWAFWNNRCYRTLKSLNPNIKMQRTGTHHNALDDAVSQAEHAIRMLR